MTKLGRVEEEVLLLEKSLYRNQFVLGPYFIDECPSWKKMKIRNSMCLTTHPDLNVYQGTHENKTITLIGYILDPDNPSADDRDIVNRLITKNLDFDKFLDRSSRFGGRWILIVDNGISVRLFHDAVGLRQVFYTDIDHASDLWCASQPGMIAERLKLRMDPSASNFINSFQQRNKEYWWPGDSCPYKEIKHLPPNHYLNLETGLRCRYWPNRTLEKLPFEDVVEKTAKTLQGLMESASTRYELAVSLTAGWDTRMLLAASKEIRNKVSYVTIRQGGMPGNHADITVPSLLASRFGLRHAIVEAPVAMDAKFAETFEKHAPFAHKKWGPDAQAIMKYNSQGRVAVVGSASEVARCFYRPLSINRSITPELLSSLVMGNDIFATRFFEKWLSETSDTFNYDILDLFYWEQRCGNWLAMSQLEFDIAWKDIFTPFNCRELLVCMLAAEEKYRNPPKYELYREAMLLLWPEVLSVSINPQKRKGVGSLLKTFLKAKLRYYIPDFIKRTLT